MEIVDRNWQLYRDPSGFSLRHPPGWKVTRHPSGATIVTSVDAAAFVLLQEINFAYATYATFVVGMGGFSASSYLEGAQAGVPESSMIGRASCYVEFKFPGGGAGLALVACETLGEGGLVTVCAAREPLGLHYAGPLLWHISRNYTRVKVPHIALASAPPNPQMYTAMPQPQKIEMGDSFAGKTTPYGPPPPVHAVHPLQPEPPAGLSLPSLPQTVPAKALEAYLTLPPEVFQKKPDSRPALPPVPPLPVTPVAPLPEASAPKPPPAAQRSVPPLPALSPNPAALTFERFTDPRAGTFFLDVPRGWQVRGGFHHAGLGDRRLFAEAHSPQGASVWFGDPAFPQTFYHNPMMWGENFVPYPQGCTFLNLAANGKKLAHYYLKKASPKHLGTLQLGGERERRDVADADRRRRPELASLALSVYEVSLRSAQRSGRCLAFAYGQKGGGMFGDNWIGNVVVWLAPSGWEAAAEAVALRMIETFQVTPQLNQIVMRDESIIAANGNAGVVNQQQWFMGQQAAHRAQEQIGDIFVSQYWEQQRANDSIMASWEHAQHVNDGIFQRGSDAMLGNERLYDESMGKEYVVPSGSNYYWVDSTSGNVVGTATDTPPDYNRDYRMLKKL